MSAERLREAAALMRERANAATVFTDARTGAPLAWTCGGMAHAVFDLGGENVVRQARVTATPHIASWHPAVALAVADWLDMEATTAERSAFVESDRDDVPEHALAVADAYLGDQR